jgi:hypothetical protein
MPKQMKVFSAARGIQLDHNWEQHAAVCEACGQFDAKKPATAAAMCLEGAVLYKRDNIEKPQTPKPERTDNYATKAQMKAAMRYKGE